MMTTPAASTSFSHEESITVAAPPSTSSRHDLYIVRLEAVTALKTAQSEQTKRTTTTPFPLVLSNLVREFGISRLLLQSASSSSTRAYPLYNDSLLFLQDEYSTGPSGVSLLVEWTTNSTDTDRSIDRLFSALVGYRLFLAPLDAAQQARLHRHVHTTNLLSPNGNLMQRHELVLPMEGSAVALEGLREFLAGHALAVCPNHGIFSKAHGKALSQVLLGDSTNIRVSQQMRRSVWMDIQSTYCADDDPAGGASCDVTLKRGIQYGVVVPKNQANGAIVKLATLVPFPSLEDCPVATRNAQLSTRGVKRVGDICDDQVQTVVWDDGDWNMDTVLNITTEVQALSRKDISQFYADRSLLRAGGAANAGTIVTRIESSSLLECSVAVSVVEVLPPYIRPLWDTWTLTVRPTLSMQEDRSIVVEWNTTLLPNTVLQVTLDYEPVLLPFQQFPADPNRGIELPPSRFTFESYCTAPTVVNPTIQVYSSPLLLMPPVPDMSMPFNVISLTCTLYAFVIGSLANLLVRKASQRIKTKLNPQENKSKLQHLKDRLKNMLAFFFKRNERETESSTATVGISTDKVNDNDVAANN